MPEQRRANNPNLCFNWFVPGRHDAGLGRSPIHSADDRSHGSGLEHRSGSGFCHRPVRGGRHGVCHACHLSGESLPAARSSLGCPIKAPAIFRARFRSWPKPAPCPLTSGRASFDPHLNTEVHGRRFRSGTERRTRPSDPRNSAEIVKQWTALHRTAPRPDEVETARTLHPTSLEQRRRASQRSRNTSSPALGHGTPLGDGQRGGAFRRRCAISARDRAFLQPPHRSVLGDCRSSPAHQTAACSSTYGDPSDQAGANARTADCLQAHRSPTVGLQLERLATRRPSPLHDVGAIINRALKSAGLIKYRRRWATNRWPHGSQSAARNRAIARSCTRRDDTASPGS